MAIESVWYRFPVDQNILTEELVEDWIDIRIDSIKQIKGHWSLGNKSSHPDKTIIYCDTGESWVVNLKVNQVIKILGYKAIIVKELYNDYTNRN